MPYPGRTRLLLLNGRVSRPLLTNLVSFWSLDETSGTRNDAHGSNHLTDNNTVTQAVGKVGNAAQFTAANSEYLSAGDNDGLDVGTGDFSTALWIYADAALTTGINGGRVMQKRGTGLGGQFAGWQFAARQAGGSRVLVTNTVFDNGAGQIAGWDSPGGNEQDVGAIGAWIFLALAVNRTAGTAKLYSNASLVATLDVSAVTGSWSNARSFSLGASIDSPTQYYSGRIDQAGFWKRLLTAAEITWLYNGGAGRSYAELAAYTG